MGRKREKSLQAGSGLEDIAGCAHPLPALGFGFPFGLALRFWTPGENILPSEMELRRLS